MQFFKGDVAMKNNKTPATNITYQSLKLLFHASPMSCIAFILLEIVFCTIPIFSAKAISRIVDIFTVRNELQINNLTLIVAFYIAMTVTVQVLSPIRNTVSERLSDKIARDSEMMFNAKLASLYSIDCFENNEFYNEMQLAKNGCGIRLISYLHMISSLLRGIVTIFLTAGYMLSIHWIIGMISLLAVIPNTFYTFGVSKNKVALFRSKTESARKLSYLSSILSLPSYAKEVRLFDLGKWILDKYHNLFDSEYRRINKVRNKQCLIGTLAAATGAIVNGIAFLLFIRMALTSKTSAGNVVLYISLLPQFIGGLQMLINSVAQTKDNNYYIKHFFDFLKRDFGEKNGTYKIEDNKRSISKITVNNLSFHYPNTESYALKNINFSIDSPSLVAIVGENGSGKSTLIKLLMRLFDASVGEILINNVPIKEYNIIELRKTFSGVFQDPARFAFTIRENLLLDSHNNPNISEEQIKEACLKADLLNLIKSSSNGLETILDKQFENGTDLSSGQWQKLSLARAFLSDASVLFFDEASADLDPKAEQRFYRSLREYAKDKIAFYVTHRLSGTKDADLIIVLKDGEIAEIGCHDELIEKNGEYSHLYHAQADGYKM